MPAYYARCFTRHGMCCDLAASTWKISSPLTQCKRYSNQLRHEESIISKLQCFHRPQRTTELLPVPLVLSREELPVVWLNIFRTSAVLRPIFSARAIVSASPASIVPINMFSTSFIFVAKPISPGVDTTQWIKHGSMSYSQYYFLCWMLVFRPDIFKMSTKMQNRNLSIPNGLNKKLWKSACRLVWWKRMHEFTKGQLKQTQKTKSRMHNGKHNKVKVNYVADM